MEIARKKPPNAIDLLLDALEDENPLVRRAAARSLLRFGATSKRALLEGLRNSDPGVRGICLTGLKELSLIDNASVIEGLKDDDSRVRKRAGDILATMRPYPKEIADYLAKGGRRSGSSPDGFPFYREAPLLRDRVDNVVLTVRTVDLPLKGWKLKGDPKDIGIEGEWYDPAFDDAAWDEVEIGDFWGAFGENHTGHAWYRGSFALPAKPENMDAAEIAFGAIDESAWVWINGNYAGRHAVGPEGWDKPFLLDVCPFLEWGRENQITVRVLNVAAAGGIWKPVSILIQKADK